MSAAYSYSDHDPSHGLFARSLQESLSQAEPKEANQATAHDDRIGRRGAARLRLSIPAKLITLYDTRRCILIDLSRTGAQVGLEQPLRMEETGVLLIGGFEIFCEVVRLAKGGKGGANGLLFDPPLQDEDVLNVRRYAETYQTKELRGLLSEVRAWVDGTI